MNKKEYEIAIIKGVEGKSISLNNYRIAGNKPWGGGSVEKSWDVSLEDLSNAIPEIKELEQELAKLKGERDEALKELHGEAYTIAELKAENERLNEFKDTATEYLGQEGFNEMKKLQAEKSALKKEISDRQNSENGATREVIRLAEENSVLKEKVEGATKALAHIRDILAQPPDRISDITIGAYADIRKKVLDITTQFLEEV